MRSRSWYPVVGIFCLGWIFMYIDRSILPPVLDLIGRDFALSKAQLGLISSLFFLGVRCAPDSCRATR